MRPRRTRIGSAGAERERAGTGDWREEGDAPRRGRLHRFGRGLALGALLLVVGYTAVAVALNLLLDPDDLAAWIAPRLGGALNRQVSVGGAAVVLIPRPGIRLSEVGIENLPAFEGPRVAAVEEVHLDFSLLPLFLGRIEVRGVRLTRPDVHLAIDEQGVTNYGNLLPESAASIAARSSGPVALRLRSIEVSDGAITFADAATGRVLRISGAGMDGRVTGSAAGDWRVVADLDSDSLGYHGEVGRPVDGSPTRPPVVRFRTAGPSAALTLRGQAGADGVEVEDGRIEHRGAILSVRGLLSGLQQSEPVLRLELVNDTLSASVIPALLAGPEPAADAPIFGGTLSVSVRIDAPGRQDGTPAVRTDVRLLDVDISRDRTLVAEGLTGSFAMTDGGATLDSLAGTLAGGPFAMSGTLSGPDRWLEGRAEAQLSLEVLDRAGVAPPGTGLSGDVSLDLTVAGSLDVPEAIGVVGTGSFEGLRVEHQRIGVPVYFPGGEVGFEGREALWSELAVIVGADRLTTSGGVSGLSLLGVGSEDPPVLEASLEGARLGLDAVFPPTPGEPDVSYARLAFAHLGNGRVDDRATGEVARELGFGALRIFPVHGSVTVALDTLVHERYLLDEVAARVELAASGLAIREVSFGIWGGRGDGSLEVAAGAGPAAPFSLTLALDRVQAQPFFATLTPVGDAVTGTLDLDLDLRGTLDDALLPVAGDLNGAGAALVTDGVVTGTGLNLALADFLSSDGWTRVPFSRWDSGWDVRDGAFDVRESTVLSPLGDIRTMGVIRLDGAADLEMALSIPPEELPNLSLRRTGIGPQALARLMATGSRLDLGLRVSGTLDGPTLEPDASVAG